MEETLAEMNIEAIRMGMVTPEQVCAHLEAFIASARRYRERRARRGRETAYDQQLSLQVLAAARAITLLQQGKEEKDDH